MYLYWRIAVQPQAHIHSNLHENLTCTPSSWRHLFCTSVYLSSCNPSRVFGMRRVHDFTARGRAKHAEGDNGRANMLPWRALLHV